MVVGTPSAIGSDNKTAEETGTTKFLDFKIDNNLNIKKKKHIDYIISKLSSTCFVMREVTPLIKIYILKLICYACLQSVMPYGVIFWVN
jgi:hypothetical protein